MVQRTWSFFRFWIYSTKLHFKKVMLGIWGRMLLLLSHQLCLTLCDPIDGSPPGSPVPGNLQARTLESVAISFSSAWKWKVKMKSLSCVLLLATSWTAAHQAPPSMGFSRQEYWSGKPLPSPLLWGRMDTCICMAESLLCSPESITTFLISYTPIQNKKFK